MYTQVAFCNARVSYILRLQASTSGIDVIKGLFARARAPTYKTMTLVRIVTDEVNFGMSKDFRSELAIFGRSTSLVAEAQQVLLVCCSVKRRS